MPEVTLELTESEFGLVSMLVGDFYRAMLKAGVTEHGRREVADLIDKLAELHGIDTERFD